MALHWLLAVAGFAALTPLAFMSMNTTVHPILKCILEGTALLLFACAAIRFWARGKWRKRR